jgi:hypothetical protein
VDDIALAEWQDETLQPIIDAAREQLRQHFRQRDDERRQAQISQWKSENVYPYQTEPTSTNEAAERQISNHVATTIAKRLPQSGSTKKVTLRFAARNPGA